MKALLIKVAFLTIAFCGVVYTIFTLKNSDSIDKTFKLMTYSPSSDRHLTLCQTRVNEIEVPGRVRIFQEGMKWFRETPNGMTAELGFVPVEKWFSKYCILTVEGITEGLIEANDTSAVLAKIGFVKGEDKSILSLEGDLYSFDKWNFRSQELLLALKDLEELPIIGGSEKGKAPGH